MDEREQENWHLNGKQNNDGNEDKKVCERFTSIRTIIGERKPNDRYDVTSRDAMQRMHIWAKVSSPMELVGVHPTCLLKKT